MQVSAGNKSKNPVDLLILESSQILNVMSPYKFIPI